MCVGDVNDRPSSTYEGMGKAFVVYGEMVTHDYFLHMLALLIKVYGSPYLGMCVGVRDHVV